MKNKLKKEDIVKLRAVLDDPRKSKEVRMKAHEDIQDQVMNPVEDSKFDPETFDVMNDVPNYDIIKRKREDLPEILETKGLKPKKCLDGQMIGMFESKQDLYLMIAQVNNRLVQRIKDLEDQVKDLQNNE